MFICLEPSFKDHTVQGQSDTPKVCRNKSIAVRHLKTSPPERQVSRVGEKRNRDDAGDDGASEGNARAKRSGPAQTAPGTSGASKGRKGKER